MENDMLLGELKRLFKKWKKDDFLQVMASSTASLAATTLFTFYNGFLGIYLLSVWHGSICVFYLLLAAIRGMILLTEKRNVARSEKEREYHRRGTFIATSAMLLVLNLALILPVSLMVMLKKPVNMGIIPAITMAVCTTYKITMACVHIRKYRRGNYNNVLVAELRTINLIDALVAVLTLQNTLIMVEQTESSAEGMFILSAASSAAIYIVIVMTTVHLIDHIGISAKQK